MIHVDIGTDFFALGSILPELARPLCPPELSPVIFEDKAWLVFAMVNFKRTRFGFIPLPRDMQHCSLMLYVEEAASPARLGNYFLESFTSFRPLALTMRYFNPALFKYSAALRLGEVQFQSPLLSAHYLPVVDAHQQSRLQQLFAESKCGYMKLRGQTCRSGLEKSHWDMNLVELKNLRFAASTIEPGAPQWELAFLTSNSRATWQLPRRI